MDPFLELAVNIVMQNTACIENSQLNILNRVKQFSLGKSGTLLSKRLYAFQYKSVHFLHLILSFQGGEGLDANNVRGLIYPSCSSHCQRHETGLFVPSMSPFVG